MRSDLIDPVLPVSSPIADQDQSGHLIAEEKRLRADLDAVVSIRNTGLAHPMHRTWLHAYLCARSFKHI